MADLPRPKKNNRTVNTDDEETVVIKVDEVQYEKQNLDNVNTAKIPVSQQNSYRQNGNNYGNNYNDNPFLWDRMAQFTFWFCLF